MATRYIYLINNPKYNNAGHRSATAFFSPQAAESYMRNGYRKSLKVTRLEVTAEQEVLFETQVIVKPPKPKAPRKKAAAKKAPTR